VPLPRRADRSAALLAAAAAASAEDALSEEILDAEQLRLRKKELKRRYGELFGRLEKLFFDHDPIGISFMPDEYDPEVERLLPEIERAKNVDDLTDRIHAIFQKMFSPEMAGPRQKYEPIAREAWAMTRKPLTEANDAPSGSAAKR